MEVETVESDSEHFTEGDDDGDALDVAPPQGTLMEPVSVAETPLAGEMEEDASELTVAQDTEKEVPRNGANAPASSPPASAAATSQKDGDAATEAPPNL